MATLREVKQEIQDVVRTGWPDLMVWTFPPSLESIDPPLLLVMPDHRRKSAEQTTMQPGSSLTWYLNLHILVPRFESSQDIADLDDYIDPAVPGSLPRLLYDHDPDGFAWWVEGVTDYGGEFSEDGSGLHGATIHLKVLTTC